MTPRISIIISVFKAEEFIEGFLNNLKSQTIFEEMEPIFIDANVDLGGLDSKLIQTFCEENKNAKVFYKPGCGVYEAWNVGIEQSGSTLLTNWNTDDRRFNDSLEIQALFMEQNPNISLCYGFTHITETPNEKIEDSEAKGSFPCLEFSKETMLSVNSPHCMPVWRKAIHLEIGLFDQSLFSAGDYDMWMRLLFKYGEKVGAKLHFFVGSYYRNPTGVSSNPKTLDAAVKEVKQIRDKYSKLFAVQSKLKENYSSLTKPERETYWQNKNLFFENFEDAFYFEGITSLDGQMFADERRAIREWIVFNKCDLVLEIGTCLGTGSTFFALDGLRTIGGEGQLITCECVDGFIEQARGVYNSSDDLKRLGELCVFEKTCSTEDILGVLSERGIGPSSLDFLILDGAEEASQTLDQILALSPYLKAGAGVFCHDWHTDKMRLVQNYFIEFNGWREEVKIDPPLSIGCRIFRKLN